MGSSADAEADEGYRFAAWLLAELHLYQNHHGVAPGTVAVDPFWIRHCDTALGVQPLRAMTHPHQVVFSGPEVWVRRYHASWE